MIAALLLAQAVAAPELPPADWSTLPTLPVRTPAGGFDPSGYVRREIAADRCRVTVAEGKAELAASVAVLIDGKGVVQRIVPHAIDCPTVEQYTAGYVSTLARRAVAAGAEWKPGWYRHVVTYRWGG
jgi:hypothetical protein